MNNSSTRAHSAGFTLIELVIVIILLGLLAAQALPRFLNVTDNAEVASLEGIAGGFSTAVVIAHAQWAAEGNSRGAPAAGASKVQINLDGKIIYMNENGWPANTDTNSDASFDTQSADECQQVWDSVLQTSPVSTTNRNRRANARYFIALLDNNPDVCRYEMILNNSPTALATHYFDYNLQTGEVFIETPGEI